MCDSNAQSRVWSPLVYPLTESARVILGTSTPPKNSNIGAEVTSMADHMCEGGASPEFFPVAVSPRSSTS